MTTITPITKDFDARLQRMFRWYRIPGLAISLSAREEIIYQKTMGYADTKGRVPFTLSTRINIASLSKLFIATALVQAIDEGYLTLDEDINELIPFEVTNPHHQGETISLRQLATHTSSIVDNDALYRKHAYCLRSQEPMTLREFLFNYLHPDGPWYSTTNFSPKPSGTSYSYSNVGATLAAYCIEARTGKPYSEFVRENIFEKLDMRNTGWLQDTFPDSDLATLYSRISVDFERMKYRLGLFKKPFPRYKLVTYPDGGVVTTAADLHKFLSAIISRQGPLTSKSIDLMLDKQFVDDCIPEELKSKGKNSGLFWSHTRLGSCGHTGGDPGVTSLAYIRPNGLAVVLLMNTDAASIGETRISAITRVVNEISDVLTI